MIKSVKLASNYIYIASNKIKFLIQDGSCFSGKIRQGVRITGQCTKEVFLLVKE